MLKRSARLRRSEFTQCFTLGRRHHSPLLTIVVLPHPTFKATVVVSKKVAKKASERNQIRRRLYALLAEQSILSGWYVFLIKPAIARLSRLKSRTLLAEEIARVMNPQ